MEVAELDKLWRGKEDDHPGKGQVCPQIIVHSSKVYSFSDGHNIEV